METLTIKGNNGFLKISLLKVFGFPDETSSFGGYDVKGNIEIESNGFNVKQQFWFTTSELFNLFTQLKPAYEEIDGEVFFRCYEKELEFNLLFQGNGSVLVSGVFTKIYSDSENSLVFEFSSDQSYITQTLSELKKIVAKYGDEKGVFSSKSYS